MVDNNARPNETRVTPFDADDADSQVLARQNGHRTFLAIENVSADTLYLRLGTEDAASDGRTLAMAASSYFESPNPRAGATGLWSGTDGGANVTEGF